MLAQMQRMLHEYMAAHPFGKEPLGLYEPADYIMNVGGKRLRPVMAMLSYRLFRDDLSRVLPVAHAIEIFHNFSLVHDDIMDDAPLRRGQPSVHERYSVNTAILTGDVMLIYAYRFLMQFDDPSRTPALVRAFNRVATEVCEGQQLDIDFEDRFDVAIDAYLRMIELKTAALLGGSMELGAIAAGAGPEATRKVARFGRYMGIAFQLQDDLLDTFGDPEKFGKKVGGDIVQNKKTFLVLKALEAADPETARAIKRWYTQPAPDETAKIEAVTRLFRELGIPQLAAETQEYYRNQALTALEGVGAPAEKLEPLLEIADKLVIREV